MTTALGLLAVVLALVGLYLLKSLHGRRYPTHYVAGEGTYASPGVEARTMRREKWTTRGGVEIE